jgi:hypothetical protein
MSRNNNNYPITKPAGDVRGEKRRKIKKDVEDFLKKGGKIKKLDNQGNIIPD